MHGYKWPINCTRTRTGLAGGGAHFVRFPSADQLVKKSKLPLGHNQEGGRVVDGKAQLLEQTSKLSTGRKGAETPATGACTINRPLITMHD